MPKAVKKRTSSYGLAPIKNGPEYDAKAGMEKAYNDQKK